MNETTRSNETHGNRRLLATVPLGRIEVAVATWLPFAVALLVIAQMTPLLAKLDEHELLPWNVVAVWHVARFCSDLLWTPVVLFLALLIASECTVAGMAGAMGRPCLRLVWSIANAVAAFGMFGAAASVFLVRVSQPP